MAAVAAVAGRRQGCTIDGWIPCSCMCCCCLSLVLGSFGGDGVSLLSFLFHNFSFFAFLCNNWVGAPCDQLACVIRCTINMGRSDEPAGLLHLIRLRDGQRAATSGVLACRSARPQLRTTTGNCASQPATR